ncbi:hypothetical protein ACL02U_14610 [Streptomyces sp. MS06]|uniref:hypothetical protein n=1 Tax=Streptomyces sp. MS06 TaxID=3385974 RepID=UPI0039A17E14
MTRRNDHHDESPSVTPSGDPLASRGRRCAGRAELIDLLQDWLARTDRPTVGDVGTFGGSAWLSVDTSAGIVHINADTTRGAVERVVRRYQQSHGAPWTVVANRRGRTNRIIAETDVSEATGWYAYLKVAVEAGTEVR